MTEIDFERQMENLVLKLIKDNDSVDIHDRYTIEDGGVKYQVNLKISRSQG
jgi:hypothetical protein